LAAASRAAARLARSSAALDCSAADRSVRRAGAFFAWGEAKKKKKKGGAHQGRGVEKVEE
jgi:hypothetical protein